MDGRVSDSAWPPQLEATIAQLGVAMIVLLPYVLLTENVASLSVSFSSVILLVILGIVHTGLAFWFYFDSVPKLRGQTIAVVSYIDPLTAIILAAIIFQEHLGVSQIIGALLILGSVFISERKPSGSTKLPTRS